MMISEPMRELIRQLVYMPDDELRDTVWKLEDYRSTLTDQDSGAWRVADRLAKLGHSLLAKEFGHVTP
jgi:hypothetical protein